MRIIYFGSSQFSKDLLEGILKEGLKPVFIVTTPDKPKGRGLKVLPNPVKEFALKSSLDIIDFSNLKSKECFNHLSALSPDLFLVVSYGKMIPQSLLSIPKIMPLAVHPSLLPKYRGAAPIQYVLLNGEKETGVTIFKITEEVDAGPMLFWKSIPIEENDDFFSLTAKLVTLSSECTFTAIENIKKGNLRLIFQDNASFSYASKLEKEQGRIDWTRSAKEIRDLIRAVKLWPGAYTFYKGKMVKILEAEVADEEVEGAPSVIVRLDKEAISVAAGRHVLKIKSLKPQGKKEMSATAFICGYRPKIGEKFG